MDSETGETIDLNITYWQRTIAERIKQKIDEHSLANGGDGYRTHLGWSVIGKECDRYLYYHFFWMWPEEYDARRNRIFINGDWVEYEFRDILKAMGAKFLDEVDTTGKQIVVSDLGGHFGGSADGVFIWPEIGLSMPTLLECKSSKTGAPFNDLAKKGLMVANSGHYVQQSGYGKKLEIQYACYICRNKNDSSIYVEIVELDWKLADKMTNRAADIMQATNVPKRINEKPTFFICNMCSVKEGCHNRKQPIPNCRNCKNSMPVENKQWFCNHWQTVIPDENAIKAGCTNHELKPW